MSSWAGCGHDGCEGTCRVRYVGAVSHIRDHHVLHAARGVGHVWTAAVVTGLAVVLTGAFAYTAAQARTNASRSRAASAADIQMLMQRIDGLEQMVAEVGKHCASPRYEDQDQYDGDVGDESQQPQRMPPPPPDRPEPRQEQRRPEPPQQGQDQPKPPSNENTGTQGTDAGGTNVNVEVTQ